MTPSFKTQKKRATQNERIARLERAIYNQYQVQNQLVKAVRLSPMFWIMRGYSYLKVKLTRFWKKYVW